MYREFQDVLTADAPALFLYSPTYSYVVSRNVNGVTPAVVMSPSDRFANIASWYMETAHVWK